MRGELKKDPDKKKNLIVLEQSGWKRELVALLVHRERTVISSRSIRSFLKPALGESLPLSAH